MTPKEALKNITEYYGIGHVSNNYINDSWEVIENLVERSDNIDYAVQPSASPKSCRRSGDCSFERIEGRCLGEACGVFDPA